MGVSLHRMDGQDGRDFSDQGLPDSGFGRKDWVSLQRPCARLAVPLTAGEFGVYRAGMEICPAFIDETGILSGQRNEQPVYGIGVLVVPDTRAITNSLYRLHFNFSSDRMAERKRIREQIQSRAERPTLREVDRLMHSTRHHEYKFSEVTRFNVQQYIDLLNLYFSFLEPQFHALILDRLDPGYNLSRWNYDSWLAYADLTRELLERQLDRDVFAIVDLQDKPDHSSAFIEDVLCTTPTVKGCLRATSDMSVYLQIVDVLLGCVQFDWKDANGYYGTTSQRAKEKRELVDFVKSRLGLSSEERLLTRETTSRIWATPSRFTVSLGAW